MSGRKGAVTFPLLHLLVAAGLVPAYRLAVRRLAPGAADELSLAQVGGLGWGATWGGLLVCLTVATCAALGGYEVQAVRLPGALGAELALWAYVAVGQEIAFRGVLLRLLQDRVGAPFAIAVSSAAFGAFHLIQPHATLWAAIALAIESVAAFALPYVLTRNLWVPIGAHFAWNAVEASLFGLTDSGEIHPSVLVGRTAGPDWLTGGAFGPEASLPAIVVCVLAAVAVVLVRRMEQRRRSTHLRRSPIGDPAKRPASHS